MLIDFHVLDVRQVDRPEEREAADEENAILLGNECKVDGSNQRPDRDGHAVCRQELDLHFFHGFASAERLQPRHAVEENAHCQRGVGNLFEDRLPSVKR